MQSGFIVASMTSFWQLTQRWELSAASALCSRGLKVRSPPVLTRVSSGGRPLGLIEYKPLTAEQLNWWHVTSLYLHSDASRHPGWCVESVQRFKTLRGRGVGACCHHNLTLVDTGVNPGEYINNGSNPKMNILQWFSIRINIHIFFSESFFFTLK